MEQVDDTDVLSQKSDLEIDVIPRHSDLIDAENWVQNYTSAEKNQDDGFRKKYFSKINLTEESPPSSGRESRAQTMPPTESTDTGLTDEPDPELTRSKTQGSIDPEDLTNSSNEEIKTSPISMPYLIFNPERPSFHPNYWIMLNLPIST